MMWRMHIYSLHELELRNLFLRNNSSCDWNCHWNETSGKRLRLWLFVVFLLFLSKQRSPFDGIMLYQTMRDSDSGCDMKQKQFADLYYFAHNHICIVASSFHANKRTYYQCILRLNKLQLIFSSHHFTSFGLNYLWTMLNLLCFDSSIF